jgi:hypothetical protein
MSDALSRGLRSISAGPRKGWELLVRAADIPGLLAFLALAAVILVGSLIAVSFCAIQE